MHVNSLPVVHCSALTTIVQAQSFKFRVPHGCAVTQGSNQMFMIPQKLSIFCLGFHRSVARFTILLTCINILLFGAKTEPLGLSLKHGSMHNIRSTNTDLDVSLVTTAHWIYLPQTQENFYGKERCVMKNPKSQNRVLAI